MSLRLIPLSFYTIKEQQEIFKAYGFSIKRVAKGWAGGINHASPRTFLSNHASRK